MFRALKKFDLPRDHVYSVTVGASSKQTDASWHLLEPADVIGSIQMLFSSSNQDHWDLHILDQQPHDYPPQPKYTPCSGVQIQIPHGNYHRTVLMVVWSIARGPLALISKTLWTGSKVIRALPHCHFFFFSLFGLGLCSPVFTPRRQVLCHIFFLYRLTCMYMLER